MWSSGIDVPKDFERLIEDITLEAVEFPPNERLWVEAGQTNQFLKVYSEVGRRSIRPSEAHGEVVPWPLPRRAQASRQDDG